VGLGLSFFWSISMSVGKFFCGESSGFLFVFWARCCCFCAVFLALFTFTLWCGLPCSVRVLFVAFEWALCWCVDGEVGFEVCGVVACDVYDLLVVVFFEECVECGLYGFLSTAE